MPGLVCVTNRTRQKGQEATFEIRSQKMRQLLSLSQISFCYEHPTERPTLQGNEAAGRQTVRNWGLPTTAWVSLEVNLLVPPEVFRAATPANGLATTPRHTRSLDHPPPWSLGIRSSETRRDNKCALCSATKTFGGGDLLHSER